MTRYPKSGKGRRWTILELKAIRADWKGDTLSDGDGLSGEVRVAADGSISVRFKFAFKWKGKVAWHACGTWPTASMEAIREARDAARVQVKGGVNPNDHKRAERIQAQAEIEATIKEAARQQAQDLPLSAMFAAWLEEGVNRSDGNKELLRAFGADVLPAIGHKPVRSLTDSDLLATLRKVGRERGKGRAAEVLLADLRQLFRWAEKRQPWRALLVEGNPAELVKPDKIVLPGYVSAPRKRVLSPDEVRELASIFERMDANYKAATDRRRAVRPVQRETQIAIWLCLATACRVGELLQARWEHIDPEAGTWHVPAENTKTRAAWTVYLSPFAARQFAALRELTSHSAWCFPAKNRPDTHVCLKSVSKQIGDRQEQFKDRTKPLKNRRQDNTLVVSNGERGEWTPHDLRRTAATWMQQLGFPPDTVDRCLNHVLAGSKARRPYMHHDYAEETRAAWAKLGERIEAILAK